ncbi:hypothetical protein Sjap_009327 [Stephania japonica]|uniref:Uncharacterized protein n=1 Tax=Stephania japonica TaxID=461633 RepID=A0AAP0JR47_9MAGN
MKREGRQHGMVRAFPIPPPPWNPRSAGPTTTRVPPNRFDSRTTAGLFTRVPTKPNNHSKFTSRCGRRARCTGCHDSPTCKAKDKAKGSHKTRASDLTVNHRLVAWTVGNGGRGFDFFGSSATAMLEHLDEFDGGSDDDDDVDDDDEEEEEGENVEVVIEEFGEPELGLDEGELGFDGGDDDEDIEEDAMSFCDVGFVMEDEIDGEIGEWCVVGEL